MTAIIEQKELRNYEIGMVGVERIKKWVP